MNKKILLIGSLLTPLIAFSCTHTKPHEPSKPNPVPVPPTSSPSYGSYKPPQASWKQKVKDDIEKIYKKAFDKFTKFIIRARFIPPTADENFEKIVNGNYNRINFGFFDPVAESKKFHDWIKIQNKDDFDQIIIKRFQELNNRNDVHTDETEIREYFQKVYLKNQDVYEFLKNNDIYITDSTSNFAYWYIVPFEENNSVVLNIIDDVIPRVEPAALSYHTTWGVFSFPKNKDITIKNIKVDRNNDDEIAYLEKFKAELYNWYNNEYKKYYND